MVPRFGQQQFHLNEEVTKMEYEVQKHLHYGGIPSFNAYPVTRELKM